MRTRAIAVVLACAPLLEGCDLRAGAATDDPQLEIRVVIQDPSGENPRAFGAGEAITFLLVVENTGDAPQTLEFASAKTHDFVVTTSKGQERWRASLGRVYSQMLTEIKIAPGETRRFSSAWDQVCGDGTAALAGEYHALGILATISPRTTQSPAAFTIR